MSERRFSRPICLRPAMMRPVLVLNANRLRAQGAPTTEPLHLSGSVIQLARNLRSVRDNIVASFRVVGPIRYLSSTRTG